MDRSARVRRCSLVWKKTNKIQAIIAIIATIGLILILPINLSGAAPNNSLSTLHHSHHPTTTTTVAPTTTTTVPSSACVINGTSGNCGPYYDTNIAWSNGYNTYAGPDGWGCGNNACGPTTFSANSAENFSVTTTEPQGNTAVLMYPSTVQYTPNPVIGSLNSLTSTYAESMPVNNSTVAWAAYDIFTSGPEVMIKTQEENACDACSTFIGNASFSGINFTVYQYGSNSGGGEIIFVPDHAVPSGSIDILAAFHWLITNGYLSNSDTIGLIAFGWEICSTGGIPETFSTTSYNLNES